MTNDTNVSRKSKPSFTHRLYVGDFAFEFIKNRRIWYSITAVMLLISVLAIGLRGLNLGIEFKGGSVFQAPVEVTESTINEFSEVVRSSGVADLEAQVSTLGDDTVRIQTRSLEGDEVVQVRAAIAEQAELTPDDVTYSLIGPQWGEQITQKAIIALVVFLVLVGVLIWIYFRDPKMSIAALLALGHDALLTVGLYALIGFSFTPTTVIAILTILGYSLYDTVVVFDMVKVQTKNLEKQDRTFSQAANAAINQVLVRSINTTLIAVLPVAAILIAGVVVLGGEGPLADLGLAMLIGMVSGAYSSIFLATPMLAQMREREPAMVAHRKALAKRRNKKDTRRAEVTEATVTASGDAASIETGGGTMSYVQATKPDSSGRTQPRNTTRSQRKK